MNIRYFLKRMHSFLFYTLNYLYFHFGSKNFQIEGLHIFWNLRFFVNFKIYVVLQFESFWNKISFIYSIESGIKNYACVLKNIKNSLFFYISKKYSLKKWAYFLLISTSIKNTIYINQISIYYTIIQNNIKKIQFLKIIYIEIKLSKKIIFLLFIKNV